MEESTTTVLMYQSESVIYSNVHADSLEHHGDLYATTAFYTDTVFHDFRDIPFNNSMFKKR